MLLPRWGIWLLSIATCIALFLSLSYASKLKRIQEQLARQSAQTQALANEARDNATQALDLARDASMRAHQGELRINEYTLQRTHLEQLAFDISRSWEANLLVELESSLRLAQQQAQLTGLADPLIAALRSAQQRIERTHEPRLIPVQSAIDSDLRRLANATVTDTAGLLSRIDRLVQVLPQLPLRNDVGTLSAKTNSATPAQSPLSPLEPVVLPSQATPAAAQTKESEEQQQTNLAMADADTKANAPTDNHDSAQQQPFWKHWPRQFWNGVKAETNQLFRVQNIENPDAALLTQDQAFFLRQNLSIQLLNARMGLLARQNDSARADLAQIQLNLMKYFDLDAPATQQALQILRQLQAHIQAVELPAITETLAALTIATNAAAPAAGNALRVPVPIPTPASDESMTDEELRQNNRTDDEALLLNEY